MLGFKKFLQDRQLKHKVSSPPPKKNHTDEIEEYPEEAARQLKNFHENMREAGIDVDQYYSTIGRKKITSSQFMNSPENHSQRVADNLDHLHHHFPEIAKDTNMKPMNRISSNIEIAKGELSNVGYIAKHQGLKAAAKEVAGKVKDFISPPSEEELLGRAREVIKNLKDTGFIADLHRDLHNFDRQHVQDWHSKNKDLSHLPSHAAYPMFKQDHENSDSMTSVMPRHKFAVHWKNLTGND